MLLANHSIFGMYGFWLPNDPRGSGSDYVASWELFRDNPLKEGKNRQKWSLVVPFVAHEAIRIALAAEGMRAAKPAPRIGGVALKSREQARRKRH